MQLERREIVRGLHKLGGEARGRKKHEKYKVQIDNKLIGSFPIPNDRDYSDTLISMIGKKLLLSNQDFSDVCKCSKDLQWYRGYLVSRNLL